MRPKTTKASGQADFCDDATVLLTGHESHDLRETFRMNTAAGNKKAQVGNNIADELRASFERVANLYPISRDADIGDTDQYRAMLRDIGLQQYALSILARFRDAVAVDMVCCLFGWRLHGMAPLDELDVGDDLIDRAVALEWLNPAIYDHEVRLELGDDPVLLVRRHGAGEWVEVERGVWGLPDILGDWSAELEVRQ